MDSLTRIPDLVIDALGNDELQSYMPVARFWRLRNFLRTGSTAISTEPDNKAKLVVVRVEFRSPSEQSLQLNFDNAACKVEWLNLDVQDDLQMAIHPDCRIHIQLKPRTRIVRVVPPKGKYVYDLVGEVDEGWLVFPGAKYHLPANGVLRLQFKYRGAVSNTLTLKLQEG